MLAVYLEQCAPISAYLPISSLNDPIEVDPHSNAVADGEVIDTIRDLAVDLERDLHNRELRALVAEFVDALPERLAEIVWRHFWLGHSQTQIANDLGVTRSAICHALAKVARLGRDFFGVTVH